MLKLNIVVSLTFNLLFISTVISEIPSEEDANAPRVQINDLFSFTKLVQPSPITSNDYNTLFEKLKTVLHLSDKDIARIRIGADWYEPYNVSRSEAEWKQLFQSLVVKYDKAIRLLMELKLPSIPYNEIQFQQFLKVMSESKFMSQTPVQELLLRSRTVRGSKRQVATFLKFADECIPTNRLKEFLHAFGFRSAINFSNPVQTRDVFCSIANQFGTLTHHVKCIKCALSMRHGFEIFGEYASPKDVTHFQTIINKISQLFKTRFEGLKKIIARVIEKLDNEDVVKSGYEDLRKFAIYDDSSENESFDNDSKDFMDAIINFRNAEDFLTAWKITQNDSTIWRKRQQYSKTGGSVHKFMNTDLAVLNYLARVTATSLVHAHPDMHKDESIIRKILSYHQFKGTSQNEKYFQCLVVFVYSDTDRKITILKRNVEKLWPEVKGASRKICKFCRLYSDVWQHISRKKFHGVENPGKSKVAELCEPGSEVMAEMMESISGANPDFKPVAQCVWDFFYPGVKVKHEDSS